MSPRELHTSAPCIHGGRLRLRVGSIAHTAQISITADLAQSWVYDAAMIYLPAAQMEALREAAAAFNAVMDRHEAGTIVRFGQPARVSDELHAFADAMRGSDHGSRVDVGAWPA